MPDPMLAFWQQGQAVRQGGAQEAVTLSTKPFRPALRTGLRVQVKGYAPVFRSLPSKLRLQILAEMGNESCFCLPLVCYALQYIWSKPIVLGNCTGQSNLMGRSPIPVFLTPEMKTKLQEKIDDPDTSPVHERHCRAILMAAEGVPTMEIARRLKSSSSQISVWRRRFADYGYESVINHRGRAYTKRVSVARVAQAYDSDPSRQSPQRGAVAAIDLEPAQRKELQDWARAPLIENRLAQRARAVLQADDGYSAPAIGDRIGMSPAQVSNWCRRYLAEGREGLRDRPRPGRPSLDLGEGTARILAALEEPPPGNAKRWTGTLLAKTLGMTEYQVSKMLRENRIVLKRRRQG